jgi:hypothetical protein
MKTRQDRLRIISAAIVLIAIVPCVRCTLYHTCIGGHLAHPPYLWEYENDILWVGFFLTASVTVWLSNMYAKTLFTLCLAALLVHNGLLMLDIFGFYRYTSLSIFAFLILVNLSVLGLFRGRKHSHWGQARTLDLTGVQKC